MALLRQPNTVLHSGLFKNDVIILGGGGGLPKDDFDDFGGDGGFAK